MNTEFLHLRDIMPHIIKKQNILKFNWFLYHCRIMELHKFFKMIYFASITWLYNDQSRVKILIDLKSFQSTFCVRERRTRTGYPMSIFFCFNSSSILTISANTLISVRCVHWTDFGTAYAMPDSRLRLNVTCGKCS